MADGDVARHPGPRLDHALQRFGRRSTGVGNVVLDVLRTRITSPGVSRAAIWVAGPQVGLPFDDRVDGKRCGPGSDLAGVVEQAGDAVRGLWSATR
ncbi:MAG: hypothetical protein M3065_04330 [Actinomycetota bacterium]|nr:hypothetical protein [Actinomycetota bacterium]